MLSIGHNRKLIRGWLIYVQPLYLRAEGGRISEMKRVVVADDNQVVMEETLEAVEPAAPAAVSPGVARPGNGRAVDLASRNETPMDSSSGTLITRRG